MSDTPKSQAVVGSSLRPRRSHRHPVPETADLRTNPSDVASLQSVLGAGAEGYGAFSVSCAKIQIFQPAPFRGPTPRIASPRRDLAIRAPGDTGFSHEQERHRKSPNCHGRWRGGFRRYPRTLRKKSNFQTGAVQMSDTTDRLSSTRSSDPCGRGRDRGGVTAKCRLSEPRPGII